MRSWWRILLVGAVVAIPGCGDDQPSADEGTEARAFTWETTLDQDGYGYVLTLDGVVGADHASYEMHVEPFVGEDGGDYSGFIADLAGAAVNGLVDQGEGVGPSETVDPDGRTDVRVLGDERWYRNPWLLDEASTAMGDAEWVRVPADEPVVADLATAVLNERYDEALRRLLSAVESGEPIEAPTPDEQGSELDEMLTPWIGLRGPAYPIGAEATVTGDADEGQAAWDMVLTSAEHGVDGEMSGTVRWEPTTAAPPTEPTPAVDVDEVTRLLG